MPMSKLKVAVIGEYPENPNGPVSGPQTLCCHLYQHLQKKHNPAITLFTQTGTRRHLIHMLLHSANRYNNTARYVYSPILLAKLFVGRFDLIHLLGFPRKITILAYLKKYLGAKILYTANGLVCIERTLGYRHYRLYEKAERQLINHADAVVTVSTSLKNKMIETGLRPRNISVIPNAIDTDFFKPAADANAKHLFKQKLHLPNNTTILLTAGGSAKVKGLPFLLQSLRELNRPDIVLLVAGPRGGDHHLLTTHKSPVINVKYLGLLDRQRLRLAYQAADVYLHLSRYESFGLAPLEAMACGCPVIVSDTVGMQELLRNGTNGCTVSYGDIQALKTELGSILNANRNLEQMGQKARQTACRLSWEHTTNQYLRIYQLIADNQ